MYNELSCFPVERENFGFISCVAVWLKGNIKYALHGPTLSLLPDPSLCHAILRTPPSAQLLLHYIGLEPKYKQNPMKEK